MKKKFLVLSLFAMSAFSFAKAQDAPFCYVENFIAWDNSSFTVYKDPGGPDYPGPAHVEYDYFEPISNTTTHYSEFGTFPLTLSHGTGLTGVVSNIQVFITNVFTNAVLYEFDLEPCQ